jgi:hypothetical protein
MSFISDIILLKGEIAKDLGVKAAYWLIVLFTALVIVIVIGIK